MSDHARGGCTSYSPALAGDNLTDMCESGAKATQDTMDAAPVLTADFWEQPEIRSALLCRHFGYFLRTYRTIQSPQVGASRLGSMTISAYTTLRHREATAAADSLLMSLSPMENKIRAIVLSDLTINAAQTSDYDRATELVSDAIELTTRTETTLAKQRLLALAATLPSTNNGADPTSVLRDQIMSTLRR